MPSMPEVCYNEDRSACLTTSNLPIAFEGHLSSANVWALWTPSFHVTRIQLVLPMHECLVVLNQQSRIISFACCDVQSTFVRG